MLQAGPTIRFVCEDHPDTLGCKCVAEMVKSHTSARAQIEQLKELNLALQIKLRESQGKRRMSWRRLLSITSKPCTVLRCTFDTLGCIALSPVTESIPKS